MQSMFLPTVVDETAEEAGSAFIGGTFTSSGFAPVVFSWVPPENKILTF